MFYTHKTILFRTFKKGQTLSFPTSRWIWMVLCDRHKMANATWSPLENLKMLDSWEQTIGWWLAGVGMGVRMQVEQHEVLATYIIENQLNNTGAILANTVYTWKLLRRFFCLCVFNTHTHTHTNYISNRHNNCLIFVYVIIKQYRSYNYI